MTKSKHSLSQNKTKTWKSFQVFLYIHKGEKLIGSSSTEIKRLFIEI